MEFRLETAVRQPIADAPRLLEDVAATLPLFSDCASRGRLICPTNAVLRRMGEAFLDDGPGVVGLPGFGKIVDAWHCSAAGGSVCLSYFLMSVILGRADVCKFATVDDQLDWDAALQWLVLHGINELQLWPYLTSRFVSDLRAPSVVFGDGLISPLEHFIIRERPTLLENTAGYTVNALHLKLAEWLLERGHEEYNLFWLLSERELLSINKRSGRPASSHSALDQYRTSALGDRASGRSKAAVDLKQLSFGTDYPCYTVDLDDPSYIRQAVHSGECRHNGNGALELLSQHTVVQYSGRRQGVSVVILELIVPELLRSSLHVKLKAGEFEDEQPAIQYSGQPVRFISEAGWSGHPLEISFLTEQTKQSERSNIGLVFGLIQSLRVWRLDRLTKSDTHPRP